MARKLTRILILVIAIAGIAVIGGFVPLAILTGGTYTIINTVPALPKNGQEYQVPILQDMSQASAYTICQVVPLPADVVDPSSNPSGQFYVAAMNFYLKKGGLETPGTQFGVAVKVSGQAPTFAFVGDAGLGLNYQSIQMPIPSPVMYTVANVGNIQFCIGASGQGILISNAANWPGAYVSGTFALDEMAMGAFANGGATAPPPPPPPPPGALNAVLTYKVAADGLTMSYTEAVSGGTGVGYNCKVGPFGDGTSDIQLGCTSVHVYQKKGSYVVAFQATDSGSGIFKSSMSVTIPGAVITTPPPTFVLKCTVSKLTASCDAIVSDGTAPFQFGYSTSGGSQTNAILVSPDDFWVAYTYANPGVYQFGMHVTDANGRKAPDQSVSIVAMYPLTVTFDYTTSDLAVSVTPSVSGGIAPYTYAWDFGDGVTSASASASHTYAANGSYNIALTVTDSAGNAATSAAKAVKVTVASMTDGSGNTTTNPGPGVKGITKGLPVVVFGPMAIILLFAGIGISLGALVRKGRSLIIGVPVGAALLVVALLIMFGILVV